MLKYSAFSMVLEVLGIVILVGMLCFAVNMYKSVPDSFPIEFGSGGEVLRYAPRATAMFHPIIAVIIYVIITGGCLAARKAAPPDTPCPRMAAVLNCIAVCKSIYLLHEIGVTYCNMSFMPVYSWLLPLAVAVGLLMIMVFAAYIAVLSKRKKTSKLEGVN